MTNKVKLLKEALSALESSVDDMDKSLSWSIAFQITLDAFRNLNAEQLKTQIRKIKEALSSFPDDQTAKLVLEVRQENAPDVKLMELAQKKMEAKGLIKSE